MIILERAEARTREVEAISLNGPSGRHVDEPNESHSKLDDAISGCYGNNDLVTEETYA